MTPEDGRADHLPGREPRRSLAAPLLHDDRRSLDVQRQDLPDEDATVGEQERGVGALGHARERESVLSARTWRAPAEPKLGLPGDGPLELALEVVAEERPGELQ